MKKLTPVLVTVLIGAAMALLVVSRARQVRHLTVFKGNLARTPVEVVFNHYQDTECGMLLDKLQDACEAVAPDGKTWFFDDAGCLAKWVGENKHRDEMVLWAYTRDTEQWVDARTAWYSRTDHTAMHYGFAAYQERKDGFLSFPEMVRKMLRGENLTNPYIRKELLGND